MSWAKLPKPEFEIDLMHRPYCGEELKIIDEILEQPVIKKLLAHLDRQARAPSRTPAGAP